MSNVDISIRIAGQAGQGMQLVASLIGKTFVRHDYYVFINQDVESRIRGGHSYTQVRIKDEPVPAIRADTLVRQPLDQQGCHGLLATFR